MFRAFLFLSSVVAASCQSYLQIDALQPVPINSMLGLTSGPLPSTTVSGEVAIASGFYPIMFGLWTSLPAGMEACDVRTHPTAPITTGKSNMIGFALQLDLWMCVASAAGPQDTIWYTHFSNAGFIASLLWSPESLAVTARFAGYPPNDFSATGIGYRSPIPVFWSGTKHAGSVSPPDALTLPITVITAVSMNSVLMAYLSDDVLPPPDITAFYIIFAVLNALLVLFSAHVAYKVRQGPKLPIGVVILEGVVASSLRAFRALVTEPAFYKPLPVNGSAQWTPPGLDFVASLLSSLLLVDVYAKTALEMRSKLAKTIVTALVALTSIGVLAFFSFSWASQNATQFAEGVEIIGGLLDLATAGSLFPNYYALIDTSRQVSQVLSIILVSLFIAISILLLYKVVRAAKLSSGVSAVARKMLTCMIPNAIAMSLNVVFFSLATQEWEFSTNTYSIVIVSSVGMHVSAFSAAVCQVAVFFPSSSSSSSSSSS